jgi:hypothetical protein
MEDMGGPIMSEWQTRTSSDPFSDTTPNGILAVRDDLWSPVRAPAETYRAPSAPTSRRAHLLAGIPPHARIFVMVAIYLSMVAAVSLIVARAVATPAKDNSAAGTGHQQALNGPGSYSSAPPKQPAPPKHPARHKRSAIQPGPAPVPSLAPSPAPTPAPSPTSRPPTSPPPTSPPPTSPPPTSPPPTSPPPTSPPPTSPPPTSPTSLLLLLRLP